ncbi:Ig-like domain-containing protein [Bradyrhizobium sp. LB12.1]|uniref:Ig-like domain-containing protein n=1 Tax=Bradyrhizobium sp. LB12.1 TaxID=3156327 RepID=UPI00339B045A
MTSDTTLTVSGSNGALGSGEKIQVSRDGGATWADATQSTATSWSYLDPATHATSFSYQTRIIDTAGNIGTTASQAVTIDTTAPNAPAISTVTDDVSPLTGSVAENGFSNDPTLTVAGTAEAGSTVTLYDTDGTTVLGTGIAVGGSYSITTAGLSQGSHTLTAKATDLAGNTGVASSAFRVAVDTLAPADIILSNTIVAENSATGTMVGSLSEVDPGGTGTAIFSLLDNAGGRFAISNGNLLVAGSLDYEMAQSHQVTVRVTDAAGNIFDKDLTVAVLDVAGVTVIGDAGANVLIGTIEADSIFGLAGNDRLQGLGGNDSLDGGAGFDRAVYADATGSVTVNLAAGTGSGAGVGSDTLISIEAAVGGDFADTFDASGFTGSSTQPGVALGQSAFEGRGGDDVITGRINDLGQSLTRVEYLSASAAVTVDLAARTGQGTAAGDAANVGHDTFTNALQGVYGSAYGDTIYGSNNANFTYEVFEGRGGNDYIDGRGGYDMVAYNNDVATTSSITINLAAGSVVGDSTIGTDTLSDVEAVRGTNFDDTFDATGYGLAGALNVSSTNGNFNDFAGAGGNDTIIGNGNTRLNYSIAQAAVTVDLQITAGTAITVAGSATGATEGTDTFTGVNAVQASVFADTLLGSSYNNTFTGLGGDDYIDGRGGFDTASYNNLNTVTGGVVVNMAAGTVTGDASSGTDTLRNIEGVQGTGYIDTYDATGYGLAGALNVSTSNGNFNQFEGLGGDDIITGNGNTRVLYSNATGAVTITIGAGGAGSASGDASTGHDSFTGGVNSAFGSNLADIYNASGFNAGFNSFQGNGGNDTITGNGSTQIQYSNATSGVTITIGASGAGSASGDGSVGTDSFTGVNSAFGGNLNDTYNASGFAAGLYNSFQGNGGNDTITGNGSTQIEYFSATAGVNVNLTTGVASGNASVGTDSITGVSGVQGSNFADTIIGSSGNDSLFGNGGDDTLSGVGGNDYLAGGLGADTFVYSIGGADYIGDFNRSEGDRIDLSGVTGVFTLADIRARATQQGSDTLIDFGSGNTITLANVTVGSLIASDFVFSNSNGTSANDVLVGTSQADSIFGLAGNDRLQGLGGNDSLDGGAGFDRAVYADATGSVTVNLAAGTGSGAGVGSDTLISIEAAVGGDFADTFDASGFTGSSTQPGVALGQSAFEGRGGDDVITGRINDLGQSLTRVEYLSASAAVTVDLAARTGQGTAAGDAANVGHDTFTNALQGVYGSAYGDTIYGSNNANFTYEVFEGRGGNDYIDGRGGYDMVAYNNDVATTSSITINLAAGSVVGDSTIGTDTLSDVEAVRGTNFDDTFDATGYGLAGALNVSSTNGNFNDFAGAGGNDTIIGNGNTRLNYSIAQAAVTVDLQITAGTAITVAGSATGATEGTDTFTGVNAVQASVFADTLLGSSYNNTFTGLGGDDYIDGRGGFDTASYNNLNTVTGGVVVNMAAGTVTGDASSGTDTLRNIEGVQGTGYIDTYDATGYGLAGALNVSTSNGNFNQFEGLGGDDIITGNGNTRVLYSNATGAVTITIGAGGAGSASGDASTGHDSFTGGVNSAFGSNLADIYNASGFNAGFNSFQGNGGNDTITGNGSTQIQYSNATSGVTIDLIAGTAIGNGSVGTDTIAGGVNSVLGSNFNDVISGTNNATVTDVYFGGGGNDTINGRGGYDLANYNDSSVSAAIDVNLAAGTVVGDGSVGSDILHGVELIRGTRFADTFDATGFNGGSTNAGSYDTFNTVEGMAGNDTVTGNGDTRVDYSHALAAVTVDLVAGTGQGVAAGDTAGVGFDTFTGGVNSIRGSDFNDQLFGSNNASGAEELIGGAGNDTIDGRGGFDRALFSASSSDTTTGGIVVDLAAGTVAGDASIGNDTLKSIESIRGTSFADTFDATGFSGSSVNAGSNSTLNEFEGEAGNDSITGNGNTRVAFYHAAAGVNVDLSTGISTSLANGDVAHVGTDTFTGVAAVRGSDFGDQISGKSGIVILDGRGGDDVLVANGGANTLIGGVGNDQFKFKAALANGATISDFVGNGAAAGDSIEFEGFGTAAQGATFTFFSAAGADSIWQIHSGLDGHNELITLKGIAASAGVHSSDYLFAT